MRCLAAWAQAGTPLIRSAEWLLDNSYLLQDQAQQIHRNLPKGFYRELPKLAGEPLPGYPRVYAVALELIAHTNAQLNEECLTSFVDAYQQETVLTSGELWALPIMCRLAIIQNLQRLSAEVVRNQHRRHQAEAWAHGMLSEMARSHHPPASVLARHDREMETIDPLQAVQLLQRFLDQGRNAAYLVQWLEERLGRQGMNIDDAARRVHQDEEENVVSVSHCITSLRFLGTHDWSEFFEGVSRVERILREDPEGTYPRMDFPTRDNYRHVVERLAKAARIAETHVARQAIRLAAEAGTPGELAGKRQHVGYYLVDRGKEQLAQRLGLRDSALLRAGHYAIQHATPWYLGTVLVGTAVAEGLVVSAASQLSGGLSVPAAAGLALLLLIPASDVVIHLLNWLLLRAVHPHPLPKLKLREGVPPELRTMVVIHTMLSTEEHLVGITERLEVTYLANRERHVHFALLSDFHDAAREQMPGEEALLDQARALITALNEKYAGEEPVFFFFHRRRLWNAVQGVWMGWERKRGKLEEFNRLLRGDRTTTFLEGAEALAALSPVQFVVTLDEDTQAPRQAVKRLIGTLAHPLNRPQVREGSRLVTEGYGVLQPRPSVTTETVGRSLFSLTFAGQCGVDPYPTAVSDLYQDLFREGLYMGKGIYDVEAFRATLEGLFPENAVLSHDLLEGSFVRAGAVADVEVVDGFPASYLSAARRTHRWTRGDWQLLPWLRSTLRTGSGERTRNPLSMLSRWKILDNLRRSLVAPATVLLLFLGLTVLPGPAWLWLALGVLVVALPLFLHLAGDAVLRLPQSLQDSSVWFLPSLAVAGRQAVLSLLLLAHQACLTVDAIARTLVRLGITRRHLLEWETAAVVDRKSRVTPASFLAQMWLATALGVALLGEAGARGPAHGWWAAPVALLWIFSPWLAYAASRPRRTRLSTLSAEERTELRRLARSTWRYFEDTVGAADHWLPPDNYQESTEPGEETEAGRVAHRTSPTNIGMYLLAVMAAHDLGFLPAQEMVERYEHTLDTLESLSLYSGHLYNWYDTETAAPLEPRYVSTADSGNLVASYWAVAQGLSELAEQPTHVLVTRLTAESGQAVTGEQARAWAESCRQAAARMEALADATDFSVLYDQRRHVFLVGYHVSADRPDGSYYDLLASEARIASFVAIAKGDVPLEHWFHLGRSLRRLDGQIALVSWNGTMFEYLMPLLIMGKFPYTLLDETYAAIVRRQETYAHHLGLPWGVSESGFNARDLQFNYQYYAFGVPSLGLRRNLSSDKVVAPYATFLALAVDPAAAMRNVRALLVRGVEGRYGLYEAVDYTPERVPAGQKFAIVRSFMAHHQGMSLVAMANALQGNLMRGRFHRQRRVAATELLLQEKVPQGAVPLAPTEILPPGQIPAPVEFPVMRHFPTPYTLEPEGHLLSNGTYTVLVTTTGAGFSRCGDTALTRWREDFTQDPWGTFLYLRDAEKNQVWSATYQPIGNNYAEPATQPESDSVVFAAEKAEFTRRVEDIESHLEVVVSPEHNAEVRRLALTNHGRTTHRLDVISYLEVVLGSGEADREHPAFHNLFVETEFLAERNALLCTRRRRLPTEHPPYLVHVVACEEKPPAEVRCETDRERFLGRGRTAANPAALEPGRTLSNTTGPVLDPVLSLGTRVELAPGETLHVAFTTGLTPTREEALELVSLYHTAEAVARAFTQAWTHSQVELRELGLTVHQAHLMQRLATRMCYPGLSRQARSDMIVNNRKGQSGLWGLGVSGDYPILLVHVAHAEELDLVQEALTGHRFMRNKGMVTDLVIVNEHRTDYFQTLQDSIGGLVDAAGERGLVDQRGGVFLRGFEHMTQEERVLLQTVAAVSLKGAAGSLRRQLDLTVYEKLLPEVLVRENSLLQALSRMPLVGLVGRRGNLDRRLFELPLAERFRARRFSGARPAPAPQPGELLFFNGRGGFTPDGHEYRTLLQGEEQTPAPWVNVLANPTFGCLVSESGPGCTWSLNSRENRLTPWANDPVCDPPGEAVYIRDEDTGEFWSPTPLPRREPEPYVVRHGQGYTVFEHDSHRIHQELLLFVPVDSPVKIYRLRLRHDGKGRRALSATFYAEWVLGSQRSQTRPFLVTDVDLESGLQTARNGYRNGDFAERLAFLDVVGVPERTLTSDRSEFIGRNGRLAAPAALFRVELSGRVGAGYDPCGACQVKLSLDPGETQEILFVLGEAGSIEEARALAARFRTPGEAEVALQQVHAWWNNLLEVWQVSTPDPALDLLLNRWLLYQVVSSRLWARTAYYQPSGAYGFRDQLQDVLALIYAAPYMTRDHLLRAAARQYREGDVQHWWHLPSGLGQRSRCSDDYLWLPFVAAEYVRATGDTGVLDEPVPYLEDRPLALDEEDRVNVAVASPETETLYQHLLRALERALPLVGEHGLPLMGAGDWNDGMNLVGHEGKGESVWLGWFLAAALTRMAPLCAARGDRAVAARFRRASRKLLAAIESQAWDGDWYRRAYTDAGVPLGSAENEECRIDSIAQSWSVLAGAGPVERAGQALAAVDRELVDRAARLIRLLAPPFDHSPLEPGYIKGYPPGVRENGGQYTHAAAWVVLATALLGDGDRAAEYFSLINPLNHARTPEEVALYRVEPYAVAGDVYSVAPHVGRGGWTWYTGAAAWMYRAALEGILGLRLEDGALALAPCLPRDWPSVTLTNRFFSTTYVIRVENPDAVTGGVPSVWLDGQPRPDGRVRRVDDGATHQVRVLLASPPPPPAAEPTSADAVPAAVP